MKFWKTITVGIAVSVWISNNVSYAAPNIPDAKLSVPGSNAVNAPDGYISALTTYPEINGGGDVVFTIDQNTPGCIGFWVSPTMQGSKQSLSVLLTAIALQKRVRIAFEGTPWNINALYCRVYGIVMIS
jgi:hypothetical protein